MTFVFFQLDPAPAQSLTRVPDRADLAAARPPDRVARCTPPSPETSKSPSSRPIRPSDRIRRAALLLDLYRRNRQSRRSNGAIDASPLADHRRRGPSRRGSRPGVVGEQPTLAPGESFRYSSGCPLRTPSGIMVGAYRMVCEDGDVFEVAIPRSRSTAAGAAGAELNARAQFIALAISGLRTLSSVAASIGRPA